MKHMKKLSPFFAFVLILAMVGCHRIGVGEETTESEKTLDGKDTSDCLECQTTTGEGMISDTLETDSSGRAIYPVQKATVLAQGTSKKMSGDDNCAVLIENSLAWEMLDVDSSLDYDESFFADNMLVVVQVNHSRSDTVYCPKKFYVKHGQIFPHIDFITPGNGDPSNEYTLIVIEVDRARFSDVEIGEVITRWVVYCF
ncbi:MAG: hypothetical protein IJY42_06185 [Clostridia bacterium]|nr:hypothetical protein [Clostridia bacterium]